jgi:hypothetical protein
VAVLTDAKAAPDILISPGPVEVGSELYRLPAETRAGASAIKYELAFWEQQATTRRLNELVETVQGVIDKVGVFFRPEFFMQSQ